MTPGRSVVRGRARGGEYGALRLLLVLAVLGLGWALSPAPVPLYDGVTFPQDPYVKAPTALAAAAELPAIDGGAGARIVNSPETGPQIQVYLPPRVFLATGRVRFRAEPLELSGSTTPGPPVSNVYRLTISRGTLNAAAAPLRVTLRAFDHKQPGVVHYRASEAAPWRALRTRALGHDSFTAEGAGLGDYVLVRGSGGSGSGTPGGVIAVVGGLVAASTALGAAVALRRRRRQPAAGGRRRPVWSESPSDSIQAESPSDSIQSESR